MTASELWVGGYGPEESSHGRGLATFREVVERDTQREVTVRVSWNIMDEGRPNTDLFRLVEEGEMFFCYFSSSYLGSRVPDLNVLETPFLFPDLAHAHRALDGRLGEELANAVRAATPFEVLGFWDNGFRHFTNRLRPVRTPGDCAGLRVRMQPNAIHEELIRAWGGIPVAVELSEAIRRITSGDVDAQENPLANTVAYGVDDVHPYVTMTGHLYGARGLWANRDRVESLPPDVGEVVRRAVAEAVATQRREAAAGEERLRARLEAKGLQFVDLTAEQRQAFLAASAPAVRLAHTTFKPELLEMAAS